MEYKVNIIVPIYNAQDYLRSCLDFIHAQTWKDFEAWLVDDGSQDGSGEICDEYAKKDSRFHVIHQENRGVSSARNAGLRAADGDFVCFVDADDWLEPTYLERLIHFINPGVDLSMCGHCMNDGPICMPRGWNGGNGLMTGDEALAFVVSDRFSSVWNKMFRMDRIREMNLTFDSAVSVGEDLLFVFQYLKGCVSGLCYFPERLYHYRQSDDSLSRCVFSASRLSLFDVLDRLEKCIAGDRTGGDAVCYPRTELAIRRKRVYCGMVSSMQLMTGGNRPQEEQTIRKRLREYCRKDLRDFLRAEDYTISEKTAVLLTSANPALGAAVYRILKGFVNGGQ